MEKIKIPEIEITVPGIKIEVEELEVEVPEIKIPDLEEEDE